MTDSQTPAYKPFEAVPHNGSTTAAVLDRLRSEGPPYIFASFSPVRPGFKFTLTDRDGTPVIFEVIRMTTAQEFVDRYPYDCLPDWTPNCYYEAEIRD